MDPPEIDFLNVSDDFEQPKKIGTFLDLIFFNVKKMPRRVRNVQKLPRRVSAENRGLGSV